MEASSDKIHYYVMGISWNDPLSFDCHLPGGCIANLRIPDGTPESTVTHLKKYSSFQNEKKVFVTGPVTWDSSIGAFSCASISLV
jgi:hypothetical protein